MRQTKQRETVLRVLQATDQHPTADWVFNEARKELPRISLGTVYRILHTLAEEGKVSVLTSGNGPSRYDGSPGPHHHAVCTACGRIADAPNLVAPDARPEVEQQTGYVISHLQLGWYGLCPACRPSKA